MCNRQPPYYPDYRWSRENQPEWEHDNPASGAYDSTDSGTYERNSAGRYDDTDSSPYDYNVESSYTPADVYPSSNQHLTNPPGSSNSLSYSIKATTTNGRRSDISYPCLAAGCTSTAHFRRVADLQRHWQSVHSGQHYDCPIRKCPRKGKSCLGRKDHLRDHLKEVHLKSPEQVKQWMDEVQTLTNLRNLKKNMTPEELAEAQEMERKMPSAKLVLGYE